MTVFSLHDASGAGIGDPAGRPTEDIVGRDTSKMKNDNNNDNSNDDEDNHEDDDDDDHESASEV